MAQFNYEEYERQQAAKRANAPTGGKNLPNTQFINSFLKNDGDTVVVRFPYTSMRDITYETTHNVRFPGDKWDKKVRCVGDGCPLCASGVKTDFRFFVKALVYQVDDNTGKMKVIPAIWDRAAAFADIDIKNKVQQCQDDDIGTLAENLVKIRKTGSGIETRYTLDIIAPTNRIYNKNTCPADFNLLDDVDPIRILTKTFEQYTAALNGGKDEAKKNTPSQDSEEDVPVRQTVTETVTESVEKEKPKEEPRRPVRFQF